MLTKYEAFFTEIYENDRFSQGVGWKCKVFFANPVLGGRTKSAVKEPNQLSEHTTIRTIELSIVNDDSAVAHDFVDETVLFGNQYGQFKI